MKKFLFLFLCLIIVFCQSGCKNINTITLSATAEALQTDIWSEKQGKVLALLKNEGQQVLKDESIIEIDSSLQGLYISQLEAVVQSKRAVLDELLGGTRKEQIKAAEENMKAQLAKYNEALKGTRPEILAKAESALKSATSNLELASKNYKLFNDKFLNTKELYEKGYASKDAYDDATLKLENAKSQLDIAQNAKSSAEQELSLLKKGATAEAIEALKASYEQARAKYSELISGSSQNAIKAAEGDLKQAEAQLLQAKNNFEKYIIKSPAKGTITSYNVDIGEVLNVGTNIGTVTDLSNLYANFYIPQKYLGSINNGMEIALYLPTVNGKILGKIELVSQTAEYTPKNIETNEAKETTVFKFKVKILDNIEKIKPGMTVTTKIAVGGTAK